VKIHFGFTVAGDRSAIDTARRVVQLLEELGHEVLMRHLVSDNAWEADRSISPRDVFRRDMAWLDQCELFIAEVSGSSFGLGFETGYPLGSTNKKVVLLYRGELEKRVSLMDSLHLALHGERRFICFLQHSHKIAAVLASAHVLLGIPRQEVYRTRGYQIIYIGAGHFGAHFGPPNFELGGRRTGVRRFRQPVIPIPLLILRRGQPNCHGVSITIRRSFLPKLGE